MVDRRVKAGPFVPVYESLQAVGAVVDLGERWEGSWPHVTRPGGGSEQASVSFSLQIGNKGPWESGEPCVAGTCSLAARPGS